MALVEAVKGELGLLAAQLAATGHADVALGAQRIVQAVNHSPVVIPYFLLFPPLPSPPPGSPQNWPHGYSEHHEKMRDAAQIRMWRFSSNFGFCGPVGDKNM